MTNTVPVSYTHLDVYKRQLVENLCGCGNYQEMNAQELITNDVSTEAKRLSAMSVSYTHLTTSSGISG